MKNFRSLHAREKRNEFDETEFAVEGFLVPFISSVLVAVDQVQPQPRRKREGHEGSEKSEGTSHIDIWEKSIPGKYDAYMWGVLSLLKECPKIPCSRSNDGGRTWSSSS